MKNLIFIELFFFSLIGYSQDKSNGQLQLLESKLNDQKIDFKKITIDLDSDGDSDYLYSYPCGEPNCLEVYINRSDSLEKQISEYSFHYKLWKIDGKNILTTTLDHCCGESPFTSQRQFEFSQDKALLALNYVKYNQDYAPANSMVFPDCLNKRPYEVNILNENYNLRYSPDIADFNNNSDDELYFMFTCESKSNIIGKLRKGSHVLVLSELIVEDRIWLYVEVKSEDLNFEQCENFIDFDFENQKARGWISARFVE